MSNDKWANVREDEAVDRAVKALSENGMNAIRVKTGTDAKAKVFELIPAGAEVFNATSVTLDTIGVSGEINDSGRYDSVRNKLTTEKDERVKAHLGAAPLWVIASVHAVTEDGKVLIASNTGSQLPADAYSADRVVWVVGTQKIVKDLDEALTRIYDYVLPLESDRARKAYNLPDDWESFVSKILIVNREVRPDRITVILVDEVLGF
jgi:hypothetical protein